MLKIINETDPKEKITDIQVTSTDIYDVVNKLIDVIRFINKMEIISPINAEIVNTQIQKITDSINSMENVIIDNLEEEIKEKIKKLGETKNTKLGTGKHRYLKCFERILPEERLGTILERIKNIIDKCDKENIAYCNLFGIETDIIIMESILKNIEISINFISDDNLKSKI